MNRQQILSRIGRDRPVVYSTGGLHTWEVLRKPWFQAPLIGQSSMHSGVHVDRAGKLEILSDRYPRYERFSLKSQVRRWKRILKSHQGFTIAYLFHPTFYRYLDVLIPDAIVYHAYDSYSHQPDWSSSIASDEQQLLARADVVIASSDEIAGELEIRSSREVLRVFNGVDYKHFSAAVARPIPDDVRSIPRPRVGYVGRINRKVDLMLLLQLARTRPEWNIVITGPVGQLDQETGSAYRNLLSCRNVWFTGEKHTTEIAQYICANDVNLMCYRLDSWARFGYPLKLHEYLASGIPVVSSRLPAVLEFQSVIRFASSCDEWERAIRHCLNENDDGQRSRRKLIARANDWNGRAEQINLILSELCSKLNIDRIKQTSSSSLDPS